jgi:hypothetical protein
MKLMRRATKPQATARHNPNFPTTHIPAGVGDTQAKLSLTSSIDITLCPLSLSFFLFFFFFFPSFPLLFFGSACHSFFIILCSDDSYDATSWEAADNIPGIDFRPSFSRQNSSSNTANRTSAPVSYVWRSPALAANLVIP